MSKEKNLSLQKLINDWMNDPTEMTKADYEFIREFSKPCDGCREGFLHSKYNDLLKKDNE